jgi:hypothetical protein
VRSSKDSYDGNDGNDGDIMSKKKSPPVVKKKAKKAKTTDADDMPPLGAVYTTRSKTRASLIPTNVEEEKEDMEVAIRESQRHRKGAHYINMWG